MKKQSLVYTSSSILLVLFLTIFFACQKEDALIESQENPESIAVFKSGDAYINFRNTVFSYSYEELVAYEESMGYKSFGRSCEELYYSIDPQEFQNVDQVKEFVEKHKEYLQLIQGSDGDLTLEVVDYKNPYRYFINNEKLFQIDNVVYKVIGDFILSTGIDNITKLKTINLENISSFEEDIEVSFLNYKQPELPNKLKDDTYNCGTNPGTGTVTNGGERTKIELDIYMDDVIWAGTCLYSHYLVRPYNRFLGIWYWCNRDLEADINVAEDYYINAWTRIMDSYSKDFDEVDEQKLEGDVGHSYVSTPGFCPHYYHFGGYEFTGQSDETDAVTISCNSGLF